MNRTTPAQMASFGKRILRGLLCLLAGWCFYLAIVLLCSPTCRHIFSERGLTLALDHAFRLACRGAGAAGLMAILANVTFIAIHLLTPRHWLIWRWPVAGLCGVLGGTIFGGFIALLHRQPQALGLAMFTAATGGFTGLFASLSQPNLGNSSHENPKS
jgi:predicted ABC-type sugar transport system permease subunit